MISWKALGMSLKGAFDEMPFNTQKVYLHCKDITVFYALYTVKGSRSMRCFLKLYSWDCFVRLHYEVIIVY